MSTKSLNLNHREDRVSQRVFSIALLVSALLVSGCERAKTKLDREVDRLCAIDGGVRVYETVKLSKENFGPNGEVFPQYRHLYPKDGYLGTNYNVITEEKVLIDGSPNLKRSRVAIQRVSDGKVLGEWVNYSRFGGDLIGPWEPSRKSCSSHVESGFLFSSVFIRG